MQTSIKNLTGRFMKKVLMFAAGTMLAASLAFAAEEETKQQVNVEQSKDSVTGTETTKKTTKTKKKMKSPHAEAEMTKKETTKTYDDGTKSTTETETTKETK